MKKTEFTSYSDDTTLYEAGSSIEDVILSLQESSDSKLSFDKHQNNL